MLWKCESCGKTETTDNGASLQQCPACGKSLTWKASTNTQQWLLEPEEEVKNLYAASSTLTRIAGFLATLMALAMLIIPVTDFDACSYPDWFFVLPSMLMFDPFILLLELGRKKWCRWLILIFSFVLIVGVMYTIFDVFFGLKNKNVIIMDRFARAVPSIILLSLFSKTFGAARQKKLFTADALSHRQLKYIVKHRSAGQEISEAELENNGSLRKKLLSYTMIMIYIQVIAVLLVSCIVFFTPHKQENSQERVMISKQTAEEYLRKGETCLGQAKFKEAFDYAQMAADAGLAEGKISLGACYLYGYGCEKDFKKAFRLFSEPEVKDVSLAKLYRGVMLAEGNGCERNPDEAFRLFSQPDVQKFPVARLYLGMSYAGGVGCERDDQKAYSYLSAPDVIIYPRAKVYIASYCRIGVACPKDPGRSFALLTEKDVINFADAQFLLGSLYFSGEGTKQDFKLAAKYMQSSADAGYIPAQEWLKKIRNGQDTSDTPLEQLLEQVWKQSQQQE